MSSQTLRVEYLVNSSDCESEKSGANPGRGTIYMKKGTKLIEGQFYWINSPKSNMNASYSGPAKCIDSKPNNDHLGGPTYMFMYPDSYYGESEGAFGLEDVVCAINNNFYV